MAIRSLLRPGSHRGKSLAPSLLGLFAAGVAQAQTPAPPPLPEWARVKHAAARKAFVVGVGTYDHATQLTTPPHDVALVAKAFEKLGFTVTPENLLAGRVERATLLTRFRQFAETLREGDIVLVYFSGHGLERAGVNYLVPSNGAATADSPGHAYVSVSHVLGTLEDAKVAAAVILLDACRDDPFIGTDPEMRDLLDVAPARQPAPPTPSSETTVPTLTSVAPASSIGLAKVDTGPPAVLLAYAAQPQRAAYSLIRGEDPKIGSIFTRLATKRLLGMKEHPVGTALSMAETDVYALTRQRQRPFQNPFGLTYLLFAPSRYFDPMEQEFWARSVSSASPAQEAQNLREFLRLFPASDYAHAARQRLAASEGTATSAGETVAGKTDIAAIDLVGPLQTLSHEPDGSTVAAANRQILLRGNWNTILKSRVTGVIKAGERVRVVGVHPGGRAVQVVNESGEAGYVGGVGVMPAEHATSSLVLRYPTGDPYAQAVNSDELERLRPPAGFAARVNAASGTGGPVPAHAAHLRVLRVRDALVSRGVDPTRIIVEFGSAHAQPDTVEITLARVGGL